MGADTSEIPSTIHVTAEYSADIDVVKKWLSNLSTKDLIACDFETAIKYTPEQLELLKSIKDSDRTPFLERKFAESVLKASALDHPAHVKITHLSVAWSDSEAFVIIMDSDEVTNYVINFLITTEIRQVWHNACYDFKHIYYATEKFPKNYEDSQIFAKTIFNHVDIHKAKTGLKELAGVVYGAWGIAKETLFTLENMYNPKLLLYAATDACATFWVFHKLTTTFQEEGVVYPTTMEDYSPWEQLPAGKPWEEEYAEAHFYHYTAKWLIKDTVRIMMNGLPISLPKVRALEEVLVSNLKEVEKGLANNPAILRFSEMRYEKLIEAYKKTQKSKMRTPNYYIKEFNSKNVTHRCFFMDVFAAKVGMESPEEKLPKGCSKWSAKLIKTFTKKYPPLKALLDHTILPTNPTAIEAIKLLAKVSAEEYNLSYQAQIKDPDLKKPVFNPGSPQQKQKLFEMLGCYSDKISKKTGDSSWDREQVEHLNKTTVDEDIIAVTQCLIDHSFSAIVKNNFIAAFYRYTLEGVLYGGYTLLGAKSGRYTSSKPNMLNTPSTKSVFAKPVKACFIAPKGFIVAAIDYAALEDRVMGNLSGDVNKKGVFLEGLDGHSLSATYYFPERVRGIIGDFTDNKKAALKLKSIVDDDTHMNCTLAGAVRQDGKPISFGLAYGCFPPKVATSVKIPIAEAEALFNVYHEELYPGVTRYREDYVLVTAKENGYVHLGLGFKIYTDNPSNDIRTLNNGTCQFWSILTTLAINRLHQLIDKAGYENDIIVTSSIYDSIYFIVRDDTKIVKWLNNTLVPIMEQDFMIDQEVKNSADLEIGPDWSKLYTLPQYAEESQIIKVRGKWH
jgi:DNA polymerase I-like protein with 3'-5' exonuclease and polymerase domains